MRHLIGATSYVFRYLLSDREESPGLHELIQIAWEAGLDRLQICENAQPLKLDCWQWAGLKEEADRLSLHLTLGCMTLDPHVVAQYLDRVVAIGGSVLRIVLERSETSRLTKDRIRSFLDAVIPALERTRIRLAIENHFEIPAKLLAESVAPYPRELIGFCIDAANSLRNFEDADRVFDFLGDRALSFHLKDYRVAGTNVDFTVSGAPFGEGQIDVEHLLTRVFEISNTPEVYLENWTPCTGERGIDISTDAKWLRISIRNLQAALLGAHAAEEPRIGRTWRRVTSGSEYQNN
jgi:sugar phosphate isomerase/epimerase